MTPNQLRQTRTVAELGLSQPAFDEIRAKLSAAGYEHAFMPEGLIDMSGIAVSADPRAEAHAPEPEFRPLPGYENVRGVPVPGTLHARPFDPLDTPLPCDVVVGHGKHAKGTPLRSVVNRMKWLYQLATGKNADVVARRSGQLEALHEATAQAEQPAPDMLAICAALGFDPTNHHNAAKCPYCRPEQPAQQTDLSAFRQGNWEHPDRNGRIVGWVIPNDAVERMGADAFALPREVADCLTRLAAAHGVMPAPPISQPQRSHP